MTKPAKKKLTKAQQQAADNKKATRAIADPSTMQGLLYQQVTKSFAGGYEIDQWELREQLAAQSQAIADGDTEQLTKLLASQALSLNALFTKYGEMAVRAEYVSSMDTYAKIALRAQSQCRATAEAISSIQNPPHATFVRQTNISNGAPQQVNNGQQKQNAISHSEADPITESLNTTQPEAITNG